MGGDGRAPMGKRALEHWLQPLAPGAKRLRHALGWVLPQAVLTQPAEGVHNDGRDNAEHDYICRVGERIPVPESGVAYEVLGSLGRGTFGQVLRCRSAASGQLAALKIIKHEAFCPGISLQAAEEVRVLKELGRCGASSQGHIVQMLDSFVHHGHICIAFELLGPDLLKVLERDGNPGMPLAFIRAVAEQLLSALQRLSCASVIHGDLKPENVLLVNDRRPLVTGREPQFKLIDFGTAQISTRVAETEDVIIQTLPYRAPEVLLGLSYTCAVDMWSFGCICAELLLGRPLFPHGGTEHDVVRNTLELLGPIPEHMLKAGRNTARYFHRSVFPTGLGGEGGAAKGLWRGMMAACWRRRPQMLVGALLRAAFSRGRPGDGRGPRWDYRLKSLRQQEEELSHGPITSLEQAISLLRYEISWTRARIPRRLRPEDVQTQRTSRLQLLDFLLRCLQTNPDERWPPARASRHAFVLGAAAARGCRAKTPRAWSLGGSVLGSRA